ncbi:predicted protein [Bathycoccus prasinos]|uniref:EF-hand domain-containing protein n=1 Tax=Bathycoccus prasinos TaxID=41875 RepID=K8F491_9CHLO|nr:predicted protein [Bathycoccus prasinos]CCO66880.1 predicted protein [Bathycoccus prasinos]|eukprot:XP_007511320.1 predicted protein [Bathycoccus prasinos]
MENVGIPTSSTRRNERRSKPRKPEDEDENERNNADAFKARKPPSRAHMTDEELVREWYAILPSMPYLTRKQVEEYKTMFDDLDIESDGRISAEDIQERLRQVGSFKTIKQIKKNLRRYDSDGNGTLDFCEFLTLMLHDLNLSNPQETLRSVFLTFDEDTDGKITAAELKRTMEMVGIPVSMREAKFVIQMADREGDGELCYDEFVDFVLGAEQHEKPGAEGITSDAEKATKDGAGVEYLAPRLLTTRLGQFFSRSSATETNDGRKSARRNARRGGDSDEEEVLSDEENVVLG